MKSDKAITLSRPCEAVQIPSGRKMSLPAGSRVWISQSHGGGTTVTTDRGDMVRIAAKDSDALGMDVPTPVSARPSGSGADPRQIEGLVWDQLKRCYDPEIPINIVDLGLVYHCQIVPLPGGGNKVEVKFTLTAPGCGMGDVLRDEIHSKLLDVVGVEQVHVDLVWDPPWDQSMISGAGKLELGIV